MFLVLYATSLVLLAVILVPTRLSIVVDSWEYFLSIRYWFYGGLLVLNGIDLVDSFMKGTEWGFRTNNLVYWAALTATAIIGLSTTRRSVHTTLGIVMLVWFNALTLLDQGSSADGESVIARRASIQEEQGPCRDVSGNCCGSLVENQHLWAFRSLWTCLSRVPMDRPLHSDAMGVA